MAHTALGRCGRVKVQPSDAQPPLLGQVVPTAMSQLPPVPKVGAGDLSVAEAILPCSHHWMVLLVLSLWSLLAQWLCRCCCCICSDHAWAAMPSCRLLHSCCGEATAGLRSRPALSTAVLAAGVKLCLDALPPVPQCGCLGLSLRSRSCGWRCQPKWKPAAMTRAVVAA